MISVDDYDILTHFDNGQHEFLVVLRGDAKLHTNAEVFDIVELAAIELLSEPFVPFAIGVDRRHANVELVAYRLAFQLSLQPGNNAVVAMPLCSMVRRISRL